MCVCVCVRQREREKEKEKEREILLKATSSKRYFRVVVVYQMHPRHPKVKVSY